MKHRLLLIVALFCGAISLNARPIDEKTAKIVGRKFLDTHLSNSLNSNDLQLVYTGISERGETCFYVFNSGNEGFVIVSSDDRFRPIVGYSDEGPFETENMSPELEFYLGKIIEARTSRNAVVSDDASQEWQSVMQSGKLISRNGGKGVDYICTTKWNQDSPYNLYAPQAASGPGGRCYAGCVATAMSQVMKHWDYPMQGTGSHSYYSNYGMLTANFGETTYDWKLMPDRLGGATQEEIEAVALLMYHCGVAVDMGFSPGGSGAYSSDVPDAIIRYFSYSTHANLKYRDSYSLTNWQNLLKESFDLGWPVYYSGFSNSGGHAFVCDGYDDNDLFHYNWGWGGSSDGWFVIDEIDYAGWAQAIFNFVPANVYDYMPMQPDNFEVNSLGDNLYSANISWNNPTQTIHSNSLDVIDQIVVTRDGEIIYTEDNVAPGAAMSFTDHYMPTKVRYSVYAIVNNAKGMEAEDNVMLGPTCQWCIETSSSDAQGWNGGHITLMSTSGIEIAQVTATSAKATQYIEMPIGHVKLHWTGPLQAVENIGFVIKDNEGQTVASFEGASSNLKNGLFFVANNTCGNGLNHNAPQHLTAHRDDNGVTLQWDNASEPVNNYCIYRDLLLIAVTESNTFTDSNVQGFHNYHVTSINDTGESDPSNPCNIDLESACEAPTNLRFEIDNNNRVALSWDAPESEGLTGYYLYRRSQGEDFKRIKSLISCSYKDNLNNHACEIYEYAVAAYYADTDCTSSFANSATQPELHFVRVNKTIIPQNLTADWIENTVVLNWEAAIHAETYNVYRNGELIAQDITENTFTDEIQPTQSPIRYTVTGKTPFIESSPSNEATVNTMTDIAENNVNEVSIYPNPTSGFVIIEGDGIQTVNVFNMLGQNVIPQVGGVHRITLDLRALPQGSYFINVVTETGIRTSKVLKIN